MAVDFGADALYVGGVAFGARRAAANSVADIARLVEYAHAFGVRVYATLNTLVFEHELHDAERLARELCDVGVDALIVQDMAFAQMNLPVALHASTQSCNTTAEGVLSLEKCGFTRVVLERGLTLEQIRQIRAQSKVELEAFIHGAICVGYSGQCYLSRTIGSRSGNRGDCSQACRMSYDLVDSNGAVVVAGKHLLSVQDMNLTPRIGQLIDAGINSFKIEGRLKDVSYIKNVVSHYRALLDAEITRRSDVARSSAGRTVVDFVPDPERSFTRGGSIYFIDGKCSGVASMDTPKAMGAYVGRVESVGRESFSIKNNDLSPADGICFICSGELVGTNVNRVEGDNVFPNRMDSIVPGVDIYRNYDHRFVSALNSSRTRRTISVVAEVDASPEQVVLRLIDKTGLSVECRCDGVFDAANNPEAMAQTIRRQVAKSGDTIFSVEEVRVGRDADKVFIPIGTINDLRRNALKLLHSKRLQSYLSPEPGVADRSFTFVNNSIGAQVNVVNSMSEQFYRQHGVTEITKGLDLRGCQAEFDGERVMISSYCIRREIGECLLEKPKLKGDLTLQRGDKRYLLEFDCLKCQMSLIYLESLK